MTAQSSEEHTHNMHATQQSDIDSLSARVIYDLVMFFFLHVQMRVQVASKDASHVLEYIPIDLLLALDARHSFDVPRVPGLKYVDSLCSASCTALTRHSLPKPAELQMLLESLETCYLSTRSICWLVCTENP